MKRFTVLFALALAALPLAAHAQSSVPTAAAASDAQSARAVPGDDSAPARALTPIEVTGRSYAQYLVDSTVA
ncbi:MAG: hypothetical protein JO090_11760, partial [Rhizobacter sp.]|nr:hypothetical protein [Rhizobacter sp.]